MDDMKDWRVGIVGVGAIGTRGHLPGYRSAGAEVVAVADVAKGRAAKVASEFGIAASYEDYREMLDMESLDVVSVCTPNALHAEITMAALGAGANVLCEKPMALTRAEATAMIEAAEDVGKGLSIAHTMRHIPEMERIKELAASGALGDIYHVRVSYLRRSGIPGYGSWFTNGDLAGGGAMMDIGCHMLDLGLWFIQHPRPTSVLAATYSALGTEAKGLGSWGADHYDPPARFDVDDFATAFVRFENGVTLAIEAAWACHGSEGNRIQVFGTKAGLDFYPAGFGPDGALRLYGEDEDGFTEQPIEVQGPRAVTGTGHDKLIADWLQKLEAGEAPRVRPEEAAAVVQIIEGIYKSAESGKEARLG
jgi:predicted dehydrogenase